VGERALEAGVVEKGEFAPDGTLVEGVRTHSVPNSKLPGGGVTREVGSFCWMQRSGPHNRCGLLTTGEKTYANGAIEVGTFTTEISPRLAGR
jgi:hypothetical protein